MRSGDKLIIVSLFLSLTAFCACSNMKQPEADKRVKVIFDTDANNELDDQHAMAYLLFNSDIFNVLGVTVNATRSGGDIDKQYEEADRVMKLTKASGKIPLLKGANKSFSEIRKDIPSGKFDGSDAVDFIIKTVKDSGDPVTLLAVGKLTTVALAVEKDPSINSKVRLVWLGSNYPDPGEYNQDNDTVAMNYLLNKNIPFEIVTVRYGKPSGTAAVTATKDEIEKKMPGLGPRIDSPVTGRHGGTFTTFGDYSVNLFQHIDYHDDSKSRALFDMVAAAIIKNPSWGMSKEISAPILIGNQWVERPDNNRKVKIWENFNKDAVMQDFYDAMKNYTLVGGEKP